MDIDVSLSADIQDGKSKIQKLIVKMLEASGKIPFSCRFMEDLFGIYQSGKIFPVV